MLDSLSSMWSHPLLSGLSHWSEGLQNACLCTGHNLQAMHVMAMQHADDVASVHALHTHMRVALCCICELQLATQSLQHS